MIKIKNCPSSLVEGFDTYNPKSAKLLFGKTKVNPILGFDIDEFRNVDRILNKYSSFPEYAKQLVDRNFLTDKLKRNYVRIVNERISRFNRTSE